MNDDVSLGKPTPISVLKGVGPRLSERLIALGISSVEELLFHFPLRYQDRTRVTPIAGLKEGLDAVVQAEVRMASIIPGRRPSLVVKVADASGLLTLRFFHFRRAQANQFKPGAPISLFGQARSSRHGGEMIHPEYRLGATASFLESALTPIYPTAEGLGQAIWRKLTDQALERLIKHPPVDLLAPVYPASLSLSDAIHYLHRPPPDAPVGLIKDWQHPAQLRLSLEELVAHHLSLQALRAKERAFEAPKIAPYPEPCKMFLDTLPFQPTSAQERVIGEIMADLSSHAPMLRLVQGDVGSGKTLVAAVSALSAIAAGYQAVLMAPTELLAEQHLRTFRAWLEPLGVTIAWLSGKVRGQARKETLQAIVEGDATLVVGTHALFQEGVSFNALALVIIDEQHRFGVHQRLALTEKASGAGYPHQLVLTATPIPRTLSMVAYADLDSSIIDELPPGRTPVTTTLVDSDRRAEVIARVGAACAAGRQAYWVCTLIEESDTLNAQAAEATAELLKSHLPKVAVGLIHGRQTPQEKERVMARFASGDLSLLVATTVIEVGVDVPNASLMIIENPERLGLAQLHQLRGRVGRGSTDSFCLLLYQQPLSLIGKERLNVLRESNDGFFIAEEDLRLRGAGELLGTRQTGAATFRVAQLPEHEHLLDEVQSLAQALLAKHPSLCELLITRWTGERQAFARV